MRAAAIILVALTFLASHSLADTPAQCLYPDFEGPWIYYLGPAIYDNAVNCNQFRYWTTQLTLNLTAPDIVVSGQQQGFWTRIYNQGAEITLNGNKYFAFSLYKTTACSNNTCTYTSYCNQTFNGWYHDLAGQNWGCFYAHKQVPVQQPFYSTTGLCNCSQVKLNEPPTTPFTTGAIQSEVEMQRWVPEKKMVTAINKASIGWTAKDYPEYATKTMRDITRRAGGKLSRRAPRSPIPALDALIASSAARGQKSRPNIPRAGALPISWDWTNVSNTNFVSPVRDQGDCGSCYAFGTTAALEARIRIATRSQQKTILSPQNIVSCSEYSQGCEGGFPYLVSKFGEDFQHVSEQCFPYANSTPVACSARCNNPHMFYYDTNYYYVGGYFGACNEQAMMEEVFYSGPVAVSFEVYSDFIHYSGGIYSHHNSTAYANLQMNPFEVTNHAVCLVGWGEENGVPFWKVKNSWGTSWGEQGFFRILRGVNECAIEEMAVAVTPVFNN